MTQNRYLIFDAYYDATGDNLRHIRALFENARADGWRPTLLCPGEGALSKTVLDAGGDVAIVPQPTRLDRYGGTVLSTGLFDRLAVLFALIAYNFRIIRTIREIGPAVVHCQNVRSLLMIGLAARLLRIPSVLYVRTQPTNPLLDWLAFALARRVLFAARALMPRRRRARFDHLPIGIGFADIDRTVAARRPDSDPEDDREHLTFIYAGWLLPVNGVHILIDAFERTVNHVSDIRLEIVGDSDDEDYKQELRNIVEWQNLGSRVTFHGWRDDLPAILDSADIYVQPSFAGGAAHPVVAAMALGKPVISTAAGGAPELLGEGEYGMLVAANDATLLADAMYRMAADRELRRSYGTGGAQTARTAYAIDDHILRLEAVFADATAGKRASVSKSSRAGAVA